MTTDELLARLARRGLSVIVSAGGECALKGGRSAASPKLLRVLKHHRAEIVRRLRPAPPREFLWPRGHRCVEVSGDAGFGDAAWFPTGAWWFRFVGEARLRPVPGRPGEAFVVTEIL